ncbi:hypothetical protein DFH09DRAFT_1331547 [Mycena vulgaris]|nr:hypothetical protein DFH09DRAFT_1331547 [Mycena vulgaris]
MDAANEVDLSQASLPDVFKHLQCDDNGLTPEEASRRLQLFGPNTPPELKREPVLIQFLSFLWNPVSWVLEVSALGLIALSSGKNRPPDWPTFLGIIIMLCVNAAIGVWAEHRAFNAVGALIQAATVADFKSKVKRAGSWTDIVPSQLVRGDIIALRVEDTVPADCRVTVGTLHIDSGEGNDDRSAGDRCLSGTRVRSGKCEAIIIYTGGDIRAPLASPSDGQPLNGSVMSLHGIAAQISMFCLAIIVIFLIAELLVLYAGFRYSYHRGIDAIFVLLLGSIPIALPTLLSVTLSFGVVKLAGGGFLVTRVAAAEELARVTLLCLEKPAVLTEEKRAIVGALAYGPFSEHEVLAMAAYAHSTTISSDNTDSSDRLLDEYLVFGGRPAGHPDIEIAHYKPYSFVDGPMQVTYRIKGSTKLKRVAKGMDRLEADVEDCAARGMSVLALAYEELEGDDPEADGNGFEMAGIVKFFEPLLPDAKHAVAELLAMGVQVKMSTRGQLAAAKEVGRQVGLGDNMFASRVLRDGAPGTRYATVDELILDAVGLAGVFPEHKKELIRRLQHMSHLCATISHGTALSTANVSITVKAPRVVSGATADLMTTHTGLSTIVDASSVFPSSLSCTSSTFRPSLILLIALATNFATLSLSVDRAVPGTKPSHWDLTEIFSHSTIYGVYLTLSTLIFVVTFKTGFFERQFGLSLDPYQPQRNNQLHTLVYLQVAQISHALIFIVRSEPSKFSLSHRPSSILLGGFCLSQVGASIIAAYGNWGFAGMHAVSARWIGLVWVWNVVWFVPLDLIKFGADFVLGSRTRRLGLLG